MIRQRVQVVALGYEDLNDHDALRDDPVVQTACERDGRLASSSTLCRFEQRAERQWGIAIHQELVAQFIASFAHPPKELVLDFDATDDPVHGHQAGRFFHGYYDCYCFLPLYVLCGQQLLVAYLRRSNIDASKHAWAILSLLVKRLRQAWPGVRIVFRGDSGFCRHRMFDWCERNDVKYSLRASPWGWSAMRCSSVRWRWRARSPRAASRRPERRAGCFTNSSTPRGAGAAADGSSRASSTDPRGETRASRVALRRARPRRLEQCHTYSFQPLPSAGPRRMCSYYAPETARTPRNKHPKMKFSILTNYTG